MEAEILSGIVSVAFSFFSSAANVLRKKAGEQILALDPTASDLHEALIGELSKIKELLDLLLKQDLAGSVMHLRLAFVKWKHGNYPKEELTKAKDLAILAFGVLKDMKNAPELILSAKIICFYYCVSYICERETNKEESFDLCMVVIKDLLRHEHIRTSFLNVAREDRMLFNKELKKSIHTGIEGLIRSIGTLLRPTNIHSRLIMNTSGNVTDLWANLIKEQMVLKGHDDIVGTLVVDKGYIISGSNDNTIRIWDKNTGKCIRILEGHDNWINTLVADEGYIISGSYDNTIRIWDKDTGECIHILKGHEDRVRTIAVDEGYIISGSNDNTIRIWDKKTGGCTNILKGHNDIVNTLVVDEGHVISGSNDNAIIIWDKNTGECIHTVKGHDGSVFSLVVDEGYIISGSSDNTIRIWDKNTGECIRILKGYYGSMNTLVVDEGHIISGSRDNTIRIWDKNTGEFIRILKGHDDWVSSLVVDEGYIISGSDDNTIRIWDKNTGECIRILKGHDHLIRTIVVDEGYIISGSNDKAIRIWGVSSLNAQDVNLLGIDDNICMANDII
jgi:WD40 repeat protein